MVDRVQFSPLGGINPQQLLAQREARLALVGTLGAGGAAANAPQPPEPAEEAEEAAQAEGQARERRQRVQERIAQNQVPEIDTRRQIQELTKQFIESARNQGQPAAGPEVPGGVQGTEFGAGAPGVPGVELTRPEFEAARLPEVANAAPPRRPAEPAFGGFEAAPANLPQLGEAERAGGPEPAGPPVAAVTGREEPPPGAGQNDRPAPAGADERGGPRGALVDVLV